MQIGHGIYTLAEAARLIHGDRKAIKRWLFGYDYSHRDAEGHGRRQYHSDPLWTPEYSDEHFGEKVIGFRDLLEIRIVREFVEHGVPLLVVRRCLEIARREFGVGDYAFSTRRFCTDGKTIFHEVLRGSDEPEMLDLRSRQYVIRDIIKPSLYAGIEYEGDVARRWYPEGKRRKQVVIDPAVQFGKPIIEEAGVPTETLYATYLAEGRDEQAAARIFEVHPRHVKAAVQFEEQLAA
jgi:uncharacterized protein (DUF433 family)